MYFWYLYNFSQILLIMDYIWWWTIFHRGRYLMKTMSSRYVAFFPWHQYSPQQLAEWLWKRSHVIELCLEYKYMFSLYIPNQQLNTITRGGGGKPCLKRVDCIKLWSSRILDYRLVTTIIDYYFHSRLTVVRRIKLQTSFYSNRSSFFLAKN